MFFVEGIRLIVEAVELCAGITTLVVAPELLDSALAQRVVRMQQALGIPCLEVSADVFKSLSVRGGYQGLGAVVRQRWEPLEKVRLAEELCWVALDAVQYPSNLGTILRTCEAVGGAGILLIGNTTDPYDPAAVRASMGAVFSQRLVRTNFAEFLAWKCRHNYVVVGTSPGAEMDYQAVTYRPPVVLLMGSERAGLSREQQALCDLTIRIPMVGCTDSLNVAVAASVVLYEMFNQRRAARGHLH